MDAERAGALAALKGLGVKTSKSGIASMLPEEERKQHSITIILGMPDAHEEAEEQAEQVGSLSDSEFPDKDKDDY